MKKQNKAKPTTCQGCAFLEAALKDEQNLLALQCAVTKEYADSLAEWKRIWSTDSRHWYETNQKQADIIAALIEGNKALRAALEKYEKYHVVSRELRA